MAGSALGESKEPAQPSMGRMAGKGSASDDGAGLKATWRTEVALMILWIVL